MRRINGAMIFFLPFFDFFDADEKAAIFKGSSRFHSLDFHKLSLYRTFMRGSLLRERGGSATVSSHTPVFPSSDNVPLNFELHSVFAYPDPMSMMTRLSVMLREHGTMDAAVDALRSVLEHHALLSQNLSLLFPDGSPVDYNMSVRHALTSSTQFKPLIAVIRGYTVDQKHPEWDEISDIRFHSIMTLDVLTYDRNKSLFFMDEQSVAGSGIAERRMALYCRQEFGKQFTFIQDRILRSRDIGWIMGPPGSGKSITAYAFALTLDRTQFIITWIHLKEGYPAQVGTANIVRLDGNKKYAYTFRHSHRANAHFTYFLENFDTRKTHIVFLDGYRSDDSFHRTVSNKCNVWVSKNRATRLLLTIASMAMRGDVDSTDEMLNRVSQHYVHSWTLQEFSASVVHDSLYEENKEFLDAGCQDFDQWLADGGLDDDSYDTGSATAACQLARNSLADPSVIQEHGTCLETATTVAHSSAAEIDAIISPEASHNSVSIAQQTIGTATRATQNDGAPIISSGFNDGATVFPAPAYPVAHDNGMVSGAQPVEALVADVADERLIAFRRDQILSKFYFAGGSCSDLGFENLQVISFHGDSPTRNWHLPDAKIEMLASGRYMFGRSTQQVIRDIEASVHSTPAFDVVPYLTGTVGLGKEGWSVIERLFTIFHGEDGRKKTSIVSEFAAVQAAMQFGPKLVERLAGDIRRFLHPPMRDWFFEMWFFARIQEKDITLTDRQTKKRVKFHSARIQYLGDQEGLLVEEGAKWLRPRKWYRGGYDAAYVNGQNGLVQLVQLSRDGNHSSFKIMHFRDFLLGLPHDFRWRRPSQTRICFVMPRDHFDGFKLSNITGRGGLTEMLGWAGGTEEERVDYLGVGGGYQCNFSESTTVRKKRKNLTARLPVRYGDPWSRTRF